MSAPAEPTRRIQFQRATAPDASPLLSLDQRTVVDHRGGRLRVLAGPGTGKTTTLVEAVADRINNRGVPPHEILVLTFSRRAGAELVQRITRRLRITTREPLVRTLHSYAYALLRSRALRMGEPSPRLLQAGESDQMVRELLAGQAETERGQWPPELSGALRTPTFAAELRELLLRAGERGITPARLADLGRRRRRPEWQAAARFAVEYQDVSDLRQGSSGLGAALDQAELTGAALAVLSDESTLAAEQARLRRIFVDEYQDVDPAQARLVERLASGADELVVFGDPDQSIYGFRGADPGALRDIEVDRTVCLTVSRRMAAELLCASRRISDRLPGISAHRDLTSEVHDSSRPGHVEVRALPTSAREAAFIADQLRRAHLNDGVPWSRMAVLARSPAAILPALHRAFGRAGVPIRVPVGYGRLRDDPAVAMLVTVLRVATDPATLTGEVALRLLTSPAADLDTAGVRRLRRLLRRWLPDAGPTADQLAAALAGAPLPEATPADLAEPVSRIAAMIRTAQDGDASDIERTLFSVWRVADLEDRLVRDSLRGGATGARADAVLDAVVAFFAMAADIAERLPQAGVRALLEAIEEQDILGDRASGDHSRTATGAVAVMSAHAAKGLEWDVVALPGVIEGRWPVTRARPSLLDGRQAIDAAAGLPAAIGSDPATLDEERRLFYVAVTRAPRRLIATAVADQDTVASRFLYELAGTDQLPTGWPSDPNGSERRRLQFADLVADLRRAVTDPSTADALAEVAAGELARLAAAGVPGAHPREWYGLAQRSTDAPALPDSVPIAVSPSAIESLTTCALRGVLERRGGSGPPGEAQLQGTVVHALLDGLARGLSREQLDAEVESFISRQTQFPPWLRTRTKRLLGTMVDAAVQWHADTYGSGRGPERQRGPEEAGSRRTLLASEVSMRVQVPGPDADAERPDRSSDRSAETDATVESGSRQVVLTGRLDRLDQRADGTVVVVDFKTGATRSSRSQAAVDPQLAAYQMAVELGAFADIAPAARSGGGELVYLRSGSPSVLNQPPPDPADYHTWRRTVRDAAEQLAASVLSAQENGRCDRCPVRSSCPLRPEGRQVTR